MKFTFAESVKLATKGFKPGDITELSELDENKFGKDDILSLVANGYSKSDIKKLVDTFSEHDDSEDDQDDDSDDHDNRDDKPDKKKHVQDDPEDDNSDDNDDNIDYKDLYEKEKKLREKLQQQNQKKGSEVRGDNKTDFDIALDIANNL